MHLSENMTQWIVFKLFPLLAAFLYAANYIFNGNIYIILGFFLILPYLVKHVLQISSNKWIFIPVAMIFVGSILNLPFTQNGIGGTLNFIACVGIALFCVNNLELSGLLAVAICISLMSFVYNSMFVNMVDANSVFEEIGLSRNYPGFMMVILVTYWGVVKYKCFDSYPLILPICALVLCFFLEGRASLGVISAICALVIFYRGKRYIFLFLLVLVAALFHYWQDIITIFSLSRFATEGIETSRSLIWKSYFEALDIPYLFFGLDTLSVPVINNYGGNPHNAFLNFHSRMGLFGLIGLIILIIKSIKDLIRRKEYVLIFYLILLLGRFFFDACIGGTTDYLFYAMLFNPIINTNNKYKARRICSRKKTIFSCTYEKFIKLI